MKNISFALTIPQVISQTKTVTRRTGWLNLKIGERLSAVAKCMGLKKGETIERLGVIEVLDVRREALNSITQDDVIKEGVSLVSNSK